MIFTYQNHWRCNKDWVEFILFQIICDYQEIEYKYLQIIILNFEFIFHWEK